MKMLLPLLSLCVGVGVGLWLARFLNPPVPPTLSNDWGSFPVAPSAKLLAEGRNLELLEDFIYVDPRKKAWVAPKGTVVNGASIPQALWSIVGGPLEGQYRNASIVHDIECVRMIHSWQEVHYMFYEACRCGGVDESRAKLLYAAVYHFGPRWMNETRTVTMTSPDGETIPSAAYETVGLPTATEATATEEDLRKLSEYIARENPSLDAIPGIDVQALQ